MENSPFKRKRNMVAPRGSINMQTQVSHEVEIELMHFIRNYNKEHDVPKTKQGKENKSQALKHILIDFLNTHCIEKVYFNNLNVLLQVSKDLSPDKVKCDVIGFVDHEIDFKKEDMFKCKSLLVDEYNFIYGLEEFNKDNYELLKLSDDYDVFDEVKTNEDSYFVIFNLNNYLDIVKNGVYMSKNSSYAHEGVIVLIDPDDYSNRLYLRIIWSYNQGTFDLNIDIEEKSYFEMTLINQIDDYNIIKEYLTLDNEIEPSKEELESEIERFEKYVEDFQKAIDYKKQLLSKYD